MRSVVCFKYFFKCSRSVSHICHHTADIIHLYFSIVNFTHFCLYLCHHSPLKSAVNMTVKMIPTVKMLIVARNRVMTKHNTCAIAEGYFLVVNNFNELLPNISTLNQLMVVITDTEMLSALEPLKQFCRF